MSAIRQIEDRMVSRITSFSGIMLDATTRKLQAFTDAPATTSEPTFASFYTDDAGQSYAQFGTLNGATPVDIVDAPGNGRIRGIKEINIYNKDSVQHTITVQVYDNGTDYILKPFVVPSGQLLHYGEVTGWQVGETGNGTVTSVALTMPGVLFDAVVPGSPVTNFGTLAPTLKTQVANTGLMGPTTGAAATPTFRALVAADIPSLSATYLPLAGGTMSGAIALPNGSAAAPELSFNTNYGFYYTASDPVQATPVVGIANAGNFVAGFKPNGLNLMASTGTSTVVNMVGDGAGMTCSFRTLSNTSTQGPTFNFQRARGNMAAPAVPQTNDSLGFINQTMFTSGTGLAPVFTVSGRLTFECTETSAVDTTHLGTQFRILLCPIGSGTLTETARWTSDAGTAGGLSMGGPNLVINNSRQFVSSISTAAIQPTLANSTTNVMSDVAVWNHTTSGTAAANFGSQMSWSWQNGSGNQVTGGRYGFRWLTATNGAEDSEYVISTIQNGTLAEKVRVTPRGYVVSPGNARVTADFTKTTDTALATVTGLSVNVGAGKTYHFEACLFYTADATGGTKFSIDGTATATDIRYQIAINTDGGTAFAANPSTQTALNGSSGQAGATTGKVVISGTITVNAAGTLTVKFAQNASNGSSSVKRGSTFIVTEID